MNTKIPILLRKTKIIFFSLMLLVFITNISKATPTQQPSNSASATATVNVHCPLFMDPVIPQDRTGELCPHIIYANGQRTWVGGWYKIYAFNWIFEAPTCHPFAIFGVNGEKNANVSLTYTTHFTNPNDMSCHGGWTEGTWNFAAFISKKELPGSGLGGSGSTTTKLRGYSPTNDDPPHSCLGGIWVAAFVSDITAGPNATRGENQLIFTLTAAYTSF
ncbi:MAG: hypothetical protein ACPL1A_06765 [Candidatus Kapaibacteriota bacterium]